MPRFMSAILLFLLNCWTYAQEEGVAKNPPAEMVDVIYVVLFGVIFFGMIVFFFWYLWWSERGRKQGGKAPEDRR